MAQHQEGAGPSVAARLTQNAEENRKLRSQYRAIQKNVHRDGDDLVRINESAKLLGHLDNLNALHTQVQNPREQAEDTDCFYLLCQKGAEAARRVIGGGKGRAPNDLIRALKTAFVSTAHPQEDGTNFPEAFNWAAMAKVASRYFKHAPGISCMLGPMEAAPKARKAVVRQPKKPLGALAAPIEVQVDQSKAEADKNMAEMIIRLRERNNINLLQCFINHKSFSQSVENLFVLSFLVRDGWVALSKAPGGGYRATFLEEAEAKRLGKDKERTQAIFGMDMDTWDDWCTRVRPEDCIMPHRDPVALPGMQPAPPSAAAAAAAAAAAPATGRRGLQKSRKGTPSRRSRQDEQEDSEDESEEDEKDEEAAEARKRKGKKMLRRA